MRIALLGCGGFIGSHLLECLLEDTDLELEGWDYSSDKIVHLLDHPRFRFHREDIYESNSFSAHVGSFDAVVSLAAICNPSQYNTRPLAVIDSNFIHAHKVVDWCSRAGVWLVHFSTSEIYGRTLASYLPPESGLRDRRELYELSEEEAPLVMGGTNTQRWSYACAKQLLERYIIAHHSERGLPYTIIRPFNFFGPRMDFVPGVDGEGIPRVLACFATALLRKEPLLLVDGGEAKRTFLYIGDAVEAVRLMLRRPEQSKNQTFNLGNRETEATMRRLAEMMRETFADLTSDSSYRELPIRNVSAEEFYGAGYEDSDRRMPVVDKALKRLEWRPRTDFPAMLRKTLAYYLEHYRHAKGSRI